MEKVCDDDGLSLSCERARFIATNSLRVLGFFFFFRVRVVLILVMAAVYENLRILTVIYF